MWFSRKKGRGKEVESIRRSALCLNAAGYLMGRPGSGMVQCCCAASVNEQCGCQMHEYAGVPRWQDIESVMFHQRVRCQVKDAEHSVLIAK